jgi:hypothetical protein
MESSVISKRSALWLWNRGSMGACSHAATELIKRADMQRDGEKSCDERGEEEATGAHDE